MSLLKFGKVYKRSDSPFFWVWYYDANGRRHRESTQTNNKKVAEEILRSRILEFQSLRSGIKTISDMPYEAFADDFLKHYKVRYPYETFKSHRSIVNEFKKFLDSMGLFRLKEITPEIINKYITYLREVKKNKACTCNNHLKNLTTQFNFAIQNKLMNENPAKGCPKIEVTDSRKRGALSIEQYQKFMEITKAEYPFYLPIYYAFLHTGLRFTELINLKWEDINFEEKILWVTKPKGKKSPEYISIHDNLIKVLESLPRESEYVFTTETGVPFKPRSRKMIRRLKKILLKAGIANISTLHELRHSYCSQLFNAGLSAREVQVQMRHKELRVTEGYAHIFRPEINRKIKRLERLDR